MPRFNAMIDLARPVRSALVAAVLAIPPGFAMAQAIDWRPYEDPELGYRIELPIGPFESVGERDGKQLFQQPGGLAQLSIYGEDNAEGRSPREIAKSLEGSDWVKEVTYRAGGSTWFVISGYYQQDGEATEELIFYVKLMMSPDKSRYSVFAISFPEADKPQFAPIVERLEDGFRPPA